MNFICTLVQTGYTKLGAVGSQFLKVDLTKQKIGNKSNMHYDATYNHVNQDFYTTSRQKESNDGNEACVFLTHMLSHCIRDALAHVNEPKTCTTQIAFRVNDKQHAHHL